MDKNSLADRIEIEDLFSRLAWASDLGSADEFVGCFTPDGVYEGVMSGFYQGPEDLRKLIGELVAVPSHAAMQVWETNRVIEITGDEAVVRSYSMAMRRLGKDSNKVEFLGFNVDRLAKIGGQWLITSRHWRPWEAELLVGSF